jgi:uncharacterized protein YcfL
MRKLLGFAVVALWLTGCSSAPPVNKKAVAAASANSMSKYV